jgi:hypothetical protein
VIQEVGGFAVADSRHLTAHGAAVGQWSGEAMRLNVGTLAIDTLNGCQQDCSAPNTLESEDPV